MIQKFSQHKLSNSSKMNETKSHSDIKKEKSIINKISEKNINDGLPEFKKKPLENAAVEESFIPINIPSIEEYIKTLTLGPTGSNGPEDNFTDKDTSTEEKDEIIPEPIKKIEKPEVIEEPLIGYKIFRDKVETFECRVSVEGAILENTLVRLILDSNEWNLIFYGTIQPDGKCIIPLKKISILSEKCKGEIRLEVIADDTMFVPWKETFVVVPSKKVNVEILSGSRNNQHDSSIKITGIKGY